MRILKDNTIAVVVDIQEKLAPHIHNFNAMEVNSIKLINGLKILDIPILITEQYTKGLGRTTEPIITELGDLYSPIEKISFSCADNSEFLNKLKSFRKKNIILLGIEAHVCVLQTMLDLIHLEFNPIVVSDCISSRNTNDCSIAVQRMRDEGAIITTYESLLLELCRSAASPEFKQISKIIK